MLFPQLFQYQTYATTRYGQGFWEMKMILLSLPLASPFKGDSLKPYQHQLPGVVLFGAIHIALKNPQEASPASQVTVVLAN